MEQDEIARVRYSRRPSIGVLLGITKAGMWTLGIALGLVAVTAITKDLLQGLVMLIIVSPMIALGVGRTHGIAWTVWVIWAARFNIRKAIGMTRFRKQIDLAQPIEHGVLKLGNSGTKLEVWEAPSGAAVVWDPSVQWASVSCMVATPGIARHGNQVMEDRERQNYTAALMTVAGSWTRRSQVCRVAWRERTRPGNVVREQQHFEALGAEGMIADSYRETLVLAEQSAVAHPQMITISLDAAGRAGREVVKAHGGGKAGVLALAELEMNTASESLLKNGFTKVVWTSPREWGAWGRGIVDPVSEAAVDVRVGGAFAGVAPELASPIAIDEEKNHIETDSAVHRAYWISEFPRIEVLPGFMGEVAHASNHEGLPIRHALQLVATPVSLDAAMRGIRDEKKTWEQNQHLKAERGTSTTVADEVDYGNITARETDLVHGQGQLAWSGFIVVSGLDHDSLLSACSSMEIAAGGADIELVKLTWQQEAALFAMAYPAGKGM